MNCEHTYKIYYKSSDLYYCFDCRHILSPFLFPKREQKEYKECIAPPMFEDFTEERWYKLTPWNISYELAKENYFYFGCIGDGEYIILPVVKEGKMIFYTARTVEGRKPKYLTAKGCKKQYWVSERETKNHVFICEGIADAVFMSQFDSSVALMGINYDGSLDDYLIGKNIVIVFDNDLMGHFGALQVSLHFKQVQSIQSLNLDKDPADYTITEMEEHLHNAGLFI